MISGTHLFGKVDIVDDRVHVATMFHHIFMLPIVYQGTFPVVDEAAATRIPISLKSILFAYVRFVLYAAIVLAILMLGMLSTNRPWDAESWSVARGAAGVICLAGALLFVTYKVSRASEEREEQLLRLIVKNAGEPPELPPTEIHVGHVMHSKAGAGLSKWMKVLLLVLASALLLFMAVVEYNEDRGFKEHGRVADVDPIVKYVEETRTTKKLLTETKTTSNLATMTYTSADGRKATFKRYVSGEALEKFRKGETVQVEYIPGEWNSERLVVTAPAQAVPLGILLPFIAFLVAAGGLVYVIRRK